MVSAAQIACGQGDLRWTHKDFADVVELIAHGGTWAWHSNCPYGCF